MIFQELKKQVLQLSTHQRLQLLKILLDSLPRNKQHELQRILVLRETSKPLETLDGENPRETIANSNKVNHEKHGKLSSLRGIAKATTDVNDQEDYVTYLTEKYR